MLRRLIPLLASLLLLSCGGSLPNTALRQHEANRHYKVSDSIPLVTLMRERHIEPPDVASNIPLLEQLMEELAKSDRIGTYKGVTYDLTYGNRLGRGWIVQTPDDWGRSAADHTVYPLDCKECDQDVLLPSCSSDADCPGGGTCNAIWPKSANQARRKVCFGHSDSLLSTFFNLITSAQHTVDINLLQPAPDARFLGTLRAAIGELAGSGRPVSVRILIGQYPPDNVDVTAFLAQLTPEAREVTKSRLRISVAAMRSCTSFDDCDSFSWNHSKIVAVDGREALVGGHNMWSQDYLIGDPVHDLSLRISGPAAASASSFADRLWEYVCANLNQNKAISLASFTRGGSLSAGDCPPTAGRHNFPVKGGMPVMAVGRLAAGITTDFANHSDLARDLMLGSARHSILISQQDLGFDFGRSDTLFPESSLERLVGFLMRGYGDVYIVLSNEGAVGNSGSSYSNGVPLTTFAKHFRDMVQSRFDARDPSSRYQIRTGPDPVNALLCEHVHLAPFRFGPDEKWPDRQPFGTHAKFWMIDDRAFYVGSDNMYPVNLQEFGYIVDDRKAAAEIRDSYWAPLWQWSQRAAVSGPGVENCIFRNIKN
jgi:phosphatidylserine/phosphatidylglycerophosphate/cardiolipin synthase-like enzyme